ncbi:MAG TPA: hypothetical protein VLZ77_07850 [Acidimicrobiales bacterium]|nr:hypothetical protein [Acidimicrobiales bacterium]
MPVFDASEPPRRRLPRALWWTAMCALVLAAFVTQRVSVWLPVVPAMVLAVFVVVGARTRGRTHLR